MEKVAHNVSNAQSKAQKQTPISHNQEKEKEIPQTVNQQTKINVQIEKVYFGSQFWRFMINWPHPFEHEVRQHIMVGAGTEATL
jgi:hypothetical protein